jgi:isoquinoline 1-oxidoreductase subunit beta
LPHVEGGQDSHTLIALLTAGEIEVTSGQVHLEQIAPSEGASSKTTLDARAVDASNANRSTWEPLREASAAARAMLIAAAARRWDVHARFCHAHEGEVIHTANWRKLRYGELAAEAARIPVPKSVELKERSATALRWV